MPMRTPLAILALLAACDKGAAPVVADARLPDPPAPKVTSTVLPVPVTEELPPRETCAQDIRRYKGLPIPPSVYPAKYMPWLESLCADDREKVDSFCQKHLTDFQVICGGIGPLHIAYPPFPRARVYRKEDGSRDGFPPHVIAIYRSTEAWEKSLTAAQKAYIAEQCPGGEDQPSSDLCGDNTPLVIALDNQRVEFVADGAFDWPTAATPWLVLDRDGNGTIDGEHELFGSATILADGFRAPNGFIALRELDENRDGRVDAADPAFAKLQLWADSDRDRTGRGAELTPASTRIVSISLENHVDLRCDARDNCEGERATLVWRDAAGLHEGAVVDVYLPRR